MGAGAHEGGGVGEEVQVRHIPGLTQALGGGEGRTTESPQRHGKTSVLLLSGQAPHAQEIPHAKPAAPPCPTPFLLPVGLANPH